MISSITNMTNRKYSLGQLILPASVCLMGLLYLGIGILKYFYSLNQPIVLGVKHSYIWMGVIFLLLGAIQIILILSGKLRK
jgi:hypothetical protein